MLEGKVIKSTKKNISCLHAPMVLEHSDTNELWSFTCKESEITIYSENCEVLTSMQLEFEVNDMTRATANDTIATDGTNKRVVKISKSGGVTPVFSTGRLIPDAICINDREQIVVGMRAGIEKPPIKVVIYSPDGEVVLREFEKDKYGKPMFKTRICRIRQNGNGHYVISDVENVLCVTRTGKVKWKNPVDGLVYGLVCDRYHNIIIADYWNSKIRLLNSNGDAIALLWGSLGIEGEGIVHYSVNDMLEGPTCLSIDKDGHLWIGQMGKIIGVKYLKSQPASNKEFRTKSNLESQPVACIESQSISCPKSQPTPNLKSASHHKTQPATHLKSHAASNLESQPTKPHGYETAV